MKDKTFRAIFRVGFNWFDVAFLVVASHFIAQGWIVAALFLVVAGVYVSATAADVLDDAKKKEEAK